MTVILTIIIVIISFITIVVGIIEYRRYKLRKNNKLTVVITNIVDNSKVLLSVIKQPDGIYIPYDKHEISDAMYEFGEECIVVINDVLYFWRDNYFCERRPYYFSFRVKNNKESVAYHATGALFLYKQVDYFHDYYNNIGNNSYFYRECYTLENEVYYDKYVHVHSNLYKKVYKIFKNKLYPL
jgi:hypothetical protein